VIEDINNVSRESLWETAQELFEEERFLRMIFIPKN
jgi:hypothetical protein